MFMTQNMPCIQSQGLGIWNNNIASAPLACGKWDTNLVKTWLTMSQVNLVIDFMACLGSIGPLLSHRVGLLMKVAKAWSKLNTSKSFNFCPPNLAPNPTWRAPNVYTRPEANPFHVGVCGCLWLKPTLLELRLNKTNTLPKVDGMDPWRTQNTKYQTGGELHWHDDFRESIAISLVFGGSGQTSVPQFFTVLGVSWLLEPKNYCARTVPK